MRNHADGQDELKNERLVKALQGQLPGVPDKELEALADRFDNDGPFHFAVLMSPMIAFVWLRLARKHVNSLQDGGLSKWKVE